LINEISSYLLSFPEDQYYMIWVRLFSATGLMQRVSADPASARQGSHFSALPDGGRCPTARGGNWKEDDDSENFSEENGRKKTSTFRPARSTGKSTRS
jgi:hypothetical protein